MGVLPGTRDGPCPRGWTRAVVVGRGTTRQRAFDRFRNLCIYNLLKARSDHRRARCDPRRRPGTLLAVHVGRGRIRSTGLPTSPRVTATVEPRAAVPCRGSRGAARIPPAPGSVLRVPGNHIRGPTSEPEGPEPSGRCRRIRVCFGGRCSFPADGSRAPSTPARPWARPGLNRARTTRGRRRHRARRPGRACIRAAAGRAAGRRA